MLGENIRKLRKQKGMSQEMLAIRMNVVRQTISKWEKEVSVPDADMLVRLADILEVEISELLGSDAEAGYFGVRGNGNTVSREGTRIGENVGNGESMGTVENAGTENGESVGIGRNMGTEKCGTLTGEQLERIAEQLAHIAKHYAAVNRRRKLLCYFMAALIIAAVAISVIDGIYKKSHAKYGYVGSVSLYKDVSCVTDRGTAEWLASCDGKGQGYYILFADYAEAEISEGYVSKFLVYVPGGFSDIDFHIKDLKGEKHIDFQIGEPYTEKEAYRLALIECETALFSEVTAQDYGGVTLAPVITKARQNYYVFGRYYAYYSRDKYTMNSVSTREAYLDRMRLKDRFGNYTYEVDGGSITLHFERAFTETENEEIMHWGMMFIVSMAEAETFSWTYPNGGSVGNGSGEIGANGSGNGGNSGGNGANGTVCKSVTRAYVDSLFDGGYNRSWEEFQVLCP